MKVGIDSYCYHRMFGEVYPDQQKPPPRKLTLEQFIDRAKELGVDGVSLESCFIPRFDAELPVRGEGAARRRTSSTASSPGVIPTAWRGAGTRRPSTT